LIFEPCPFLRISLGFRKRGGGNKKTKMHVAGCYTKIELDRGKEVEAQAENCGRRAQAPKKKKNPPNTKKKKISKTNKGVKEELRSSHSLQGKKTFRKKEAGERISPQTYSRGCTNILKGTGVVSNETQQLKERPINWKRRHR